MKSEWNMCELGKVAELTVGFVGTMAAHYTETGVPFLRSTNIEPFNVKMDDLKYISPEFNKTLKKSELHTNDVVIVRTGKPGACTVIPQNIESWNCSDLVIIRPHKNKLNPLFLASYINLASGVINAHLVGAVQQHFNVGAAKKMLIPIPPIKEQNRIAAVVQMLNDKIELNLKINDNLEQQVSAIYKSWFEGFNSTNGACPQTWSYQRLSAIANISSGKRPPVKSETYSQETPVPIVGAAAVMGFTSEANHTDRILVTGRVGTHGIIQRFNTPCWVSDNAFVITSPYYEFVNQILHRIDYKSMNRGSTQPLITQGDMKKLSVLVPDKDTLAKFEKLAGTLMAKWEANNNENSSLVSLRNILLPELMSGEIDVSNIQP